MKRIWAIILIFSWCLFLVACSNSSSTAKIETKKSGTINTNIYSSEEVKKDDKIGITPLLETDDKDITDDGKGLYRVYLEQDGEGSVSVSEEKVQAGTTVTVNVTPANEWKVQLYVLDYQIVDSTTFVMPEHDVTFRVVFQNKRHNVSYAGYNDASWIICENGMSCVEGETFYFTINLDENSSRYFEDEDVFAQSSSYNEQGEYEKYKVTKVGDNRYSFVMPEGDCVIGCNTHEYMKVLEIVLSDSKYNTIGNITKEQNGVSDYIDVTMSRNGVSFLPGEYAKQGQVIISIDYLNPLYEIEHIEMSTYGSYNSEIAKKVDDTHYSFNVSYGYLFIFIKDYELPEGTYNISCLDTENGSIQVDKSYATKGETVIVSVEPDEGYILDKLQYVVGDSNEYVDIANIYDVYSFAMPEGEVKIKASFISANTVHGSIIIIDDWTGEELTLEQFLLKIDKIVLIDDTYTPQPYIESITNDLVLSFEVGTTVNLRFYYKNIYTVADVTYSSDYSYSGALLARYGGQCDCYFVVDGDFILEIHVN